MLVRIREIALWVGAILGSLALLWTVAMFAFALTPLVFTSGSMSPEIKAGDLAFAKTISAEEISKEDIVSVENAAGVRVTHRVVKVELVKPGSAVLQLQGDANKSPDAEAYNVTNVERVSFSVPKAGYVINWASSPIGMFAGGMFVMGLLLVAFMPRNTDRPEQLGTEPKKKTSKRHRRKATTLALGGVVVATAAVGSLITPVEPTLAAFTDSGTMTTGSVLSSGPPPRPASMTCANEGTASARLTWPAFTDAAGHRVAYRVQIASNSSWSNPTNVIVLPTGAANYSFLADSDLGGWFSSLSYFIRVQAAYVDGNNSLTWFSVDNRAWSVSRAFLSTRYRCDDNLTP